MYIFFPWASCRLTTTQEELLGIIGQYDGIVVRSGVTMDEDLISAAKKIRIIGRAGTGQSICIFWFWFFAPVLLENKSRQDTLC